MINLFLFSQVNIFSMIGGFMNAAVQAKTNEKNINAQEKMNAENLAFQRENLDYQKALQQEIFAREDTAYQRAVDDARSAGLSPLAISGGANAGQVVATSPLNAGSVMPAIAPTGFGDSMIGMESQIANYGLSEAQAGLYRAQLDKVMAETDDIKSASDFWNSYGIPSNAPEWFTNFKLASGELPKFMDQIKELFGLDDKTIDALKSDGILKGVFNIANRILRGEGATDILGFKRMAEEGEEGLLKSEREIKKRQKASAKAQQEAAKTEAYYKELAASNKGKEAETARKKAEKQAEKSKKAQEEYYYAQERHKIMEYYFGK